MKRQKYQHEEDEIDRVTQALAHLKDEQGMEAAWAALPDGMERKIKRLSGIPDIGFVRAVEILLRLGQMQWTS